MRIAALALLALAGCAQNSIKPLDLGPLHLSCPAECKASCIPDQWPQWTGDPDSPQTWDTWPEQVALELRQMVETCDARRAVCVKCIGNAESVGVVCGVTRECG